MIPLSKGLRRFFWTILSAILYLTCLGLPAVKFERLCNSKVAAGLWNTPIGTTEVSFGLPLLLLGGLGVIFLQAGAMGWLANPLYFLALVTSLENKIRAARILSFTALGFGLVSLHLTNWYPLLADEAGVCRQSAIQPLIGHWMWLTSMVLLTINACFFRSLPQTQDKG